MENYEKYAEFTKAFDWDAISKLNGVDLDSFGTKKELKALPEYLEQDEVVFALTSGMMNQTETSNTFDFGTNTWLVVLTSDRFLFMDAAMITKSVDTQSIRHEHVQGVSASQGLMSGKIMVDLGSRMLVIDNCHKSTVKALAAVANKWLKEIHEKKHHPQHALPAVSQTPMLDMLERLHKLESLGAFTNMEFSQAKESLLKSEEFKSEKAVFLASLPSPSAPGSDGFLDSLELSGETA